MQHGCLGAVVNGQPKNPNGRVRHAGGGSDERPPRPPPQRAPRVRRGEAAQGAANERAPPQQSRGAEAGAEAQKPWARRLGVHVFFL